MKYGYKHLFEKSSGGIKKILLTPVCNILQATLDKNGTYDRIELKNPEKMVECAFAEGAALYREEEQQQYGMPSVTHTLEFYTDKIDEKSDRLIRDIIKNSCCGLAALVTTNNNISLLVGYSEENKGERPLKIHSYKANSGKIHTDTSNEAICLTSKDNAKARVFSGNIR